MNFDPMATQIKIRFKNVLQTVAFGGAFFIFAVVGSLTSMACMVPAVLFRGWRARCFGQKLIHALFVFFVGYLRAFGLLELGADGLSELRNANGLIVVANHPSLLDAVLLAAQMPQAVCLMKGNLARNIVLSGTARLAGYIHNKSGLGLVKKCEERLKEGSNLLVFPKAREPWGANCCPSRWGSPWPRF